MAMMTGETGEAAPARARLFAGTRYQVQQTEDADDKLTALGRGVLHNDIVEMQECCRQRRHGDDNGS